MAFEVFTRDFVRSRAPKVTISSLGRFSINNSASAMLKKTIGIENALLLWDKSNHQIGIEPVKKGDHRSYPLKAYGPKGKSGTGFSAVTFLNFINYDWSETRSFPAVWTGTMLVVTIPAENVTGKPTAQDGSLGDIRRKDRHKVEL